jgi:hypothetical protein
LPGYGSAPISPNRLAKTSSQTGDEAAHSRPSPGRFQ